MGRSVSKPCNTIAHCYRDVSDIDEFNCEWEWSYFKEWIRETCMESWPSLSECDQWLGKENNAILENDHCYIGVSEYCGLACIWLVSKKDEKENTGYPDQSSRANLADHWCYQISDKFHKLFGEYAKISTFSNGESLYQRITE